MPKSVVELAQLNTFSKSSDGGQIADTATRGYKVLLTSPDEVWDPFQEIGLNIGDPYLASNPGNLPLVGIDVRADGDSRLVRIVTATFRNSPGGVDGSGGGGGGASPTDRRTKSPELRAPLYTMSTSLQELPTSSWRVWDALGLNVGGFVPAVNPAGDIYDGVTKLEPVTTISIEQYSFTDGTSLLEFVGYVNSDQFNFSGLAIFPHQCMLQSISSQGHVETFGNATFRGFKLTFTFGYKTNWVSTRGGEDSIGWDIAVPQSGYNIKNTGLGVGGVNAVDDGALALAHENFLVKEPYELAPNTLNKKVRAHILHAARGEEKGAVQGLAAQPVALNDDGSPRDVEVATPPVLINRYATQQSMVFGDDFVNFGINSFY